mmetsp:Transcript_32207/g.28539  ORF Transcript_32207/g.28539 Transcript_32207/m.28539 type:complete len:262 (+) Transcript_32207:167-952(+)|eukprot:CAMPEP_0205822962 /NCGR_PEP_ID=MMETSP0206-20130828/14549_1 /ASSEMBLY_ACC=CAM_ASM_000279 /TAXON_ID=36767 /ORGANISM="Euplotes focardii, Strain TN1" /LENGTH=261 /DNA_ID=CAMNT_0053119677 /DNA_START=1 /DNA_END=786 /DNA_ORIENTATION=+
MSTSPLDGYDETQVNLMKENLILVDTNDKVVGKCSKKDGHLRTELDQPNAQPHRAFSAFIFNEKNEMLLQRRSDEKITFPNMWTNTCCSHPLYVKEEMSEGPLPFQGIKTAAVRRLDYELGMRNVFEEDFNMLTKILYRANTDATWAEYELDFILFAKKHSDELVYEANKNEISHTEFVGRNDILDFLEAEVNTGKSQITPWFNMVLQSKMFGWWDHLINTGELPQEDTSGHIINYIEGEHAINAEDIPSIEEYKRMVANQ